MKNSKKTFKEMQLNQGGDEFRELFTRSPEVPPCSHTSQLSCLDGIAIPTRYEYNARDLLSEVFVLMDHLGVESVDAVTRYHRQAAKKNKKWLT